MALGQQVIFITSGHINYQLFQSSLGKSDYRNDPILEVIT